MIFCVNYLVLITNRKINNKMKLFEVYFLKTHVIARPDFAVEVNKVSSPHVITFNCYFLEDFFEKGNMC